MSRACQGGGTSEKKTSKIRGGAKDREKRGKEMKGRIELASGEKKRQPVKAE